MHTGLLYKIPLVITPALVFVCCFRVFGQALGVMVMQWLGVGLVIERSLVRLPAGALSSQVGQHQHGLPSLEGRQIEYQPAWLGFGGARSLVSEGR